MMAGAALIEPGDPAWTATLGRVRHDVYHLPGYVRIDAGLSGGTPAAFRYEHAGHVLLLPLVLRPVPDTDLRDAISPYGYPGPVSDGGPEFWARAGHALTELLGTRGIITAFVRLHPLLPAPTAALSRAGTVVQHGETVSVDLSLTAEQMWQQTHRTHRNQINKARRAGVSVVFDDWGWFDEWIGAYHATMRRVGAAEFYFFGAGHFHRLRAALGDRIHLAAAVSAGGELLGGNLFFSYAGIMHTHLQATRDGDTQYADKLLYDEVRRWGRDRGHTVYHLGGGLGGQADSLFRYKAAFASGRHAFHTWRVVTDPGAFEKLAGTPTPESLAGRFPPYR
ncbi:GNAT family N-acetyltransferase [Actinoplanes sp. NPDC049599]|uniref:GNAT family N-acetyltransferase n=1 Tax=Actinoplanes sp. NPDC049599 TaxID=3363903 RepID=UPI00378B44B9